jgi:uncharacterized protein YjbI with pentapeptide repeats
VSPDSERARARIDAVRTGLATGGGAGAGVALLLAFRRQHHTEASSASSEYDAAERRITELYTKAVEQLGNDQAAVRLGGLYALERLAQNNTDRRQTIVDVICAYLRMPYTLTPSTVATSALPAPQLDAGSEDDTSGRTESGVLVQDRCREELQVRLTAQRILASHVRDPQSETPFPVSFWDVDLDLTGAILIEADFSCCRPRNGVFDRAIFAGHANFEWTTFPGDASFDGATFAGDAAFGDATFTSDALFGGAVFTGEANFERTAFYYAWFRGATFGGDARFDWAHLDSAWFEGATFEKKARFQGTTFGGEALVSRATFTDEVELDKARVASLEDKYDDLPTGLILQDWPAGWTVRPGRDHWGVVTAADVPE